MQIDRESLVQRYEDLVDAELLRRLRSGELTELAHEVAMAELQARGLNLEPERVAAAPASPRDGEGIPSDEAYAAEAAAAPAEVALAADQFERNPYQAPRATQIQRRTKTARLSPGDLAWWGYIVLLVLISASGPLLNPGKLLQPSYWLGMAPLAGMIVGLIAWRRRRPLGHALLWVALLAVFLAQFAFAAHFYVELLSHEGAYYSPGMMVLLVSGALVQLPGIWGLLHYTFFSNAIWRPQPTA